jgi:hypothetical protein
LKWTPTFMVSPKPETHPADVIFLCMGLFFITFVALLKGVSQGSDSPWVEQAALAAISASCKRIYEPN